MCLSKWHIFKSAKGDNGGAVLPCSGGPLLTPQTVEIYSILSTLKLIGQQEPLTRTQVFSQ